MDPKDIHLGGLIANLLDEQHKTKRDLGIDIGMSASNAVYLTTRESMDVKTLHKIGNVLHYNFWKLFPIDDGTEKPKTGLFGGPRVEDLQGKIAELEGVIAEMKREAEVMRLENGYLKEINGLLKASPPAHLQRRGEPD